MNTRIKSVRQSLKLSHRDIEKLTGIDRQVWLNVEAGRQRVNQDHLMAIEKLAPQYIYWIVTGKTLPIAGQISPNEPATVTIQQTEYTEMKKTGTHG